MTAGPDPPVLHALLSGDGTWASCRLDGLEVTAAGRVELRCVPAVEPPWLAPPASTEPSGLALDDACRLYVSDAEAGCVERVALDCGERHRLCGGWLERPAGMCVGPNDWLFVAEPQARRIVVLTTPRLIVRDVWQGSLERPVAVAPDGGDGVFVLDAGGPRVVRFDPVGRPDVAANVRLAASRAPRAIATAPDRTLYVADEDAGAILCFAPDAAVFRDDVLATALAVDRAVLHSADPVTGLVQQLDRADGSTLGTVEGFSGPVSALAIERNGRLHIKTGADGQRLLAVPGAARTPRGTLTAGPVDAGEGGRWARVAVALKDHANGLQLETATSDDADEGPQWTAAPSTDALVLGDRHLWVRLTFERPPSNPAASLSVSEIHAETEGDSYLDHLPAVYAREQDAVGFLARLLALARSELGDLEAAIALLHRSADPAVAPPASLTWLAGWQGFAVPARIAGAEHTRELRAVLAELPEINARRGTPGGVARLAVIASGVRPRLVEDFANRRIWMLGHTSALGFDTALPARPPEGFVVGTSGAGNSGPEEAARWGAALFEATAHRFTALVHAAGVPGEQARARLLEVLEAERPSHAAFHLCVIGPCLRVGLQARLGLDAIVAGPPRPPVLDGEERLDVDTRLGAPPDGAADVRLGMDSAVR